MNKLALGLIAGLALGAGGVWLALHHGADAAKPAEAAAAPAPAEKPKENPLHLPPAKRTAAGIVLVKPEAGGLKPEVQAYGRTLDVGPLAALIGELETAKAALDSSGKEAARAKKLFAAGANASEQTVETTEAAEVRDRAAVASARARLIAAWGKKIADGASLAGMMDQLEKGSSLARLDVLPGENVAPDFSKVSVSLTGSEKQFDAEVLGPAPVADAQTQGTGYLVVVQGSGLPAGTAVRAILPGVGDAENVMMIPRSAVVYHEGSAWIYVLGEEDTFERHHVTLGRSVGDKVAVTAGVEEADQIVTRGAQQLLSAELQAGQAPDEG